MRIFGEFDGNTKIQKHQTIQNEVSNHLEEQMKINSNQNSKPKILKVDSHLGIDYHSDRP
jgi:hypothetical protein